MTSAHGLVTQGFPSRVTPSLGTVRKAERRQGPHVLGDLRKGMKGQPSNGVGSAPSPSSREPKPGDAFRTGGYFRVRGAWPGSGAWPRLAGSGSEGDMSDLARAVTFALMMLGAFVGFGLGVLYGALVLR